MRTKRRESGSNSRTTLVLKITRKRTVPASEARTNVVIKTVNRLMRNDVRISDDLAPKNG